MRTCYTALLALLASTAAACASPVAAPDVIAPDAAQDAASDAVATPDATPPFDGAVPHAFRVDFPPTAVNSGQETTLCVQLSLGNPTAQLVRHGHVTLAPGSHHLIVYRMPAGTSTYATPRTCGAFSGVASGAPAMMMAQASDSDLLMPDGVGLEIEANQVVRIEEHFINLDTATIQGTGTVTLDTIDPSDAVVRANMFFWGPLGIHVAAHTTGAVDYFRPVLAGTHIIAMSTHQHHLGTLAVVRQATSAAATDGTEVYRNTNWAEPPVRGYDPALLFDGTGGVQLHCEWNNTTSQPVVFGESAATDEMCFVGGFYYPSHGFEYCADDYCRSI
jgi:hypothetical protein